MLRWGWTSSMVLGALGATLLVGCSGDSAGANPGAGSGGISSGGTGEHGGSPSNAGGGGRGGSEAPGSSGTATGGGVSASGASGASTAGGAPVGPCVPGALPCPTPPESACAFDAYKDHYYFFCDSLVDHAAALQNCTGVGMNLVHIDDAEENAFLAAVTNSGCCPNSNRVSYVWNGLWIGASDAASEGAWLWEDDQTRFWQGTYSYVTEENGTAVDGRFASWASMQPNDAYGLEDCARTSGLRWSDTSCLLDPLADPDPFNGIGYICEGVSEE